MEKTKIIKIFAGTFYLILVGVFLYLFFSKVSIQELTSYEFIKNNNEYFNNLKHSNLALLSLVFVIFTIIWVAAAGFISPLTILAGFIFGKWLGLFLLLISVSIGATILFLLAGYFFKDLIIKKFQKRFHKVVAKFEKSEFFFLLIYRFVGGIPFALSNILPCLFNIRVSNFFLATFIGLAPQFFLLVAIGSGLEKVIKENSSLPKVSEIIFLPEIYLPFLGFITILIITIMLRKFFYK